MNVTNTSGVAINVDGQIIIPSGATNFYIPDEENLYTRVIQLASAGKVTFSAGSSGSGGNVTVSNFPAIQAISIVDGGSITLGIKGDPYVTDPTAAQSLISAVKGLQYILQNQSIEVVNTQATPVITSKGPIVMLDPVSIAANGDLIPSTDVSGYLEAIVHVTAIPSGTVSFYFSQNGVAWNNLAGVNMVGGTNYSVSSIATTGGLKLPLGFKYLKATVSGWTAGTITAIASLNTQSTTPTSIGAGVIVTGTPTINLTQISGTAIITGGLAGSLGIGGLGATNVALVGNPVLIAGSDGTKAQSIGSGVQASLAFTASTALPLTLIGGTDGTNARTFLVDTAGRLQSNINQIAGGTAINGGVTGSLAAAGNIAHGAAGTASNPMKIGARAVSALYTTLATGNVGDLIMTLAGALISKPYSIPEQDFNVAAPKGGLLNTVTPLAIKEAAGAGLRTYITSMDLYSEAVTNATEVEVREADLTCSSQTIASNIITTSANHGLSIGDPMVFTASTMTGPALNTTYFVLTTPAANTMTLSASRGGTTLTISGTSVTATLHKCLWNSKIPTTGRPAALVTFPTPLKSSVNTALLLQTVTASGVGAVFMNFQGYVGP